MISQKITVNNPSGLHLRPAGGFYAMRRLNMIPELNLSLMEPNLMPKAC